MFCINYSLVYLNSKIVTGNGKCLRDKIENTTRELIISLRHL